MSDPTLFDVEPPVWAQDAIGQRWWEWSRTHPEVGRAFVTITREWMAARPGERVGAKAVWEQLRWRHAVGQIPTSGAEPFKLNNVYTALYARWCMDTYPETADVFETRRRIAA